MGNQLTLEWKECGAVKFHVIDDRHSSKNPGTVRLGRDPNKCDIVLANPTVSGLHIEIFFNEQDNKFWLRNLRESNPPVVDQKRLISGEVPLDEDSVIYLGDLQLVVKTISVDCTIAPTILVPPPVPGISPSKSPQISPQSSPQISVAATKPPSNNYGLECPCCHRVSPYERLDLGCPWCGTSLAAAHSVVMP
ncbi:FHA domain-containing protein [Ancylothrix sp. C2]|uniref:FHA domain-containing protein n=1 Tax=Ancylothrix sp. D3o TaxID=2953691 RepID=UPI0021BAF385|nr:FHA domain-containing protein [Ancylothrix sp. D3o]MCT7951313.1 FHA domain-containing protein [Ancylothrix sp. D3o]